MAQERILVVDDEPQILRFLRPSLAAAGYEVLAATTGTEALHQAATAAPDAILLDLGLPDLDGMDVIARLRQWSGIPIIVLSARDREAEKIRALDLGADDYVNKPFGVGELLARLRTAMRHAARRVDANANRSRRFKAGVLEIDVDAHTAVLGGKSLKLTPKEFELLVMLARHAGRVVTHRQILTSVWGPAHVEDLQYLRVFIGQLRLKLDAAGDDVQLIQTEPGIGYRFSSDAE